MLINLKKNNKLRKQDGFTILIAVIAASILLIIAISIGGIALKEQVLSASGKESQIAYYAADTAMECALYWDQKIGIFSPDSSGNPPAATKVICNNDSNDVQNATLTQVDPNHYQFDFALAGIPVEGGGTTCALVTITKGMNDASPHNGVVDTNRIYTTINSYGYNTCTASLSRLERGILANY